MERRNFLRGAVIGTSAAAFGDSLWRGAAYAAPAQPFSPDGSRLCFSSRRGTSGSSSGGITYEVGGPFRS